MEMSSHERCIAFFSSPSAGVCIPRLVPTLVELPALAASGAPASYWLTRSLFLRSLGGIFAVAFSVALRQNPALIGDQVGGEWVAGYCWAMYCCFQRAFIIPTYLCSFTSRVLLCSAHRSQRPGRVLAGTLRAEGPACG